MAGLAATTAALARYRKQARQAETSSTAGGALVEAFGFGSNPGELRMLTHSPDGLAANAPLVVVLHGCTQSAASYAEGAGWIRLADQLGFVLLCPEQKAANNQNRCFNWFEPADVRRGSGEVDSIHQMIQHAVASQGLDASRVYVAGLSAGGAMAAAMLATYPEDFAAGAIVAGLPYRAASNVQEAFACMFQAPTRTPRQWGDLVRQASPHKGPWPHLSIWQGSADSTVIPQNARELVRQWTDVHSVDAVPDQVEHAGRDTHERWLDRQGRVVVEAHTIAGMGHGTPFSAAEGVGAPGPFVLEAGICSSSEIARAWGLGGADAARVHPRPGAKPAHPAPMQAQPRSPRTRPASAPPPHAAPSASGLGLDVGKVINDALRTAGLLKS